MKSHSFLSPSGFTTIFLGQSYKLHPKDFGERTQTPVLLETGQGLGEAFTLGSSTSAPLHFTGGGLTRKHSPLYAHLKAPKVEGN